MRRKLTATSVRQLRPPEKGQIQYNDSELPGFALRVSSNDVRSFVLQYRPRSGPHKGRWTRWTVGRLASSPEAANGADLLTLGQAREIARHARVAIRDQGADPARDGKHPEGDDGPESLAIPNRCTGSAPSRGAVPEKEGTHILLGDRVFASIPALQGHTGKILLSSKAV